MVAGWFEGGAGEDVLGTKALYQVSSYILSSNERLGKKCDCCCCVNAIRWDTVRTQLR